MAIRYALGCDQGHEFEAWFASADAYDTQRGQGLVTCPVCASAQVAKRVMAPFVSHLAGSGEAGHLPAPENVPDAPAPDRSLRDAVRALHAQVAAQAENVGPRFAEEARRIHFHEAEHRSIYGQASGDEVRSLVEDGVAVVPLPPLPDEHN